MAFKLGNKTLSVVADVIRTDEFKEQYDLHKNKFSEKDPQYLVELLGYYNKTNLELHYDESYWGEDNYKYEKVSADEIQMHRSVCCYLDETLGSTYTNNLILVKALVKWSEDHRIQFEPYWSKAQYDLDYPLKEGMNTYEM